MWRAHDGMGWWMVFGGLSWVVTLVLLAYVFVALLSPAREPREPPEPPAPGARRGSPLEVAQRRYASGEITREQFRPHPRRPRWRSARRRLTRGAAALTRARPLRRPGQAYWGAGTRGGGRLAT